MSAYAIREGETKCDLFYEKGCIIKREEGACKRLVEGVREYFTLFYDRGQLGLIYQCKDGEIRLLLPNGESCNPASDNKRKDNVLLHLFVGKGIRRLVYNQADSKSQYIVTQLQLEHSSWRSPQCIDEFVPFSNEMYRLCRIDNEHQVLFYRRNMPENQFGYRELSRYGVGSFKCVYSTGYKLVDYTMLTLQNSLHFVFEVQCGVYTRLIYVCKTNNEMCRQKTIYEGGFVKLYNIEIVHNRLYVYWKKGDRVYSMVSHDMGEGFKRGESRVESEAKTRAILVSGNQSCDSYVADDVMI